MFEGFEKNGMGAGVFGEETQAAGFVVETVDRGEEPMTASDGYFIGSEVNRNKRAAQWAVAPIEVADLRGRSESPLITASFSSHPDP